MKRMLYLGFLFFYLYMPVIGGVFTAYFVGLAGWIYILFYSKRISVQVVRYVIVFGVAGLYIILMGIIHTHFIMNTAGAILYLSFFSFPGAYLITDVARKRSVGLYEMIENIAIVSFIQGIISVIFFLSDEIRIPVLELMGYDVSATELADILRVRLFGVAAGLTYSMPAVQAIIGTLVAVYALRVKNKRRYLIYVPVIWFSGIINARTAVVLIIIGIFFIVISAGTISKENLRHFFGLGVIFPIIAVVLLNRINSDTSQWVRDGIAEMTGFLTKGHVGYYFTALFSERFLSLPRSLHFIFGTGIPTFSDVGFIRNLWSGGIILCLVIYGAYYSILKKIESYVNVICGGKFARKFFVYGAICLLLLNIKGEICGINEVSALLVLFYLMYDRSHCYPTNYSTDFSKKKQMLMGSAVN